MRAEPPTPLFGRPIRTIHCLGVGGMGVGPLALYLAGLGFAVSGEDDALGKEMAERLAAGGVRAGPMDGAGCDLLVHSSAIGPAHPGYSAAARRGLFLARRGEVLAEAVRGRKLVAVCGAHGKTTTTAMAITALRAANFPAGFVLGGLFADGSPPARAGSNEWVVAEIDESDGTIGAFAPEITVAVNLDWDHPDFYREPEQLEAAFAALFRRTRGTVLTSDACARSVRVIAATALVGSGAGHFGPGTVAAGERCNTVVESDANSGGAPAAKEESERAANSGSVPAAGPVRTPAMATFGKTGDFAARVAREEGEGMELELSGKFAAGRAQVRARGEFNAANAAAALAAAQLMGVAPQPAMLAKYPGVRGGNR